MTCKIEGFFWEGASVILALSSIWMACRPNKGQREIWLTTMVHGDAGILLLGLEIGRVKEIGAEPDTGATGGVGPIRNWCQRSE